MASTPIIQRCTVVPNITEDNLVFGNAAVLLLQTHSTSGYRAVHVIGDAIIPYDTDPATLGTFDELSAVLGSAFLTHWIMGPAPAYLSYIESTITISVTSRVRIFYYPMTSDFQVSAQAIPEYDDFIITVLPPLRSVVTPDYMQPLDVATAFEIYMPPEYAGFVILGDMPSPYIDPSSGLYDAYNDGKMIWPGSSISVGLTGPTRVRIYYSDVIDAITPMYGSILPDFDDFIILVNTAPQVTVLEYGNVASFEEPSLIKFSANMPCSISYTYTDLETKLVTVDTISIDETLRYDLPVIHTSTIKFTATDLDGIKTSEEKYYYFKREPKSNKSIYSTFTDQNGYVDNNLENDPMITEFIDAVWGEGGRESDGAFTLLDFTLLPTINSFLAGITPYMPVTRYSGYRESSWNFPYADVYCGKYNFRLHYKLVGASHALGRTSISINIGDTDIRRFSDEEGWVVGTIDGLNGNSVRISMSLDMYSPAMHYLYLEIDVFEILNPPVPIQLSGQMLQQAYTYGDYSDSSILLSSLIPVYNTVEDPTFLLECTTNGETPTEADSAVERVGYGQLLSQKTIVGDATFFQRIMYQGTELDRSGGFQPSVYVDSLVKVLSSEPNYINSQVTSIEDFTLGTLINNWTNDSNLVTGRPAALCDAWKLTSNGLRSPKIYGNTSTIRANNIENIMGQYIIITYIVVPSPEQTILQGALSIAVDHGGGNSTQSVNVAGGEHTLELSIGSTWCSISFAYTDYGYWEGLNTLDQYVLIKKIEFTDRAHNVIDSIPSGPYKESFNSGPLALPWVFNGAWDYPPIISESYYSEMLLHPIDMGDSSDTSIYITLDCIDGSLIFYWGSSSELGWDMFKFFMDGTEYASISGNTSLTPVVIPVTLGMRQFKWQYSKDSGGSSSVDTVFIRDISFPTIDNIVLNADTFQSIDVVYEGHNIGPMPWWNWELGSSFLPARAAEGIGTTVSGSMTNSMSVTMPLTDYYYSTGYDSYVSWNFSVKAVDENYVYYYVFVSAKCDWDRYYSSGGPYYYTFWNYEPYYSGDHQRDVTLPRPVPETGTITFTVEARNAPFDISVYFSNLEFPVKMLETVSITPVEEIVEFPINCTLLGASDDIEVYYSINGDDPAIYPDSAIKYTSPIAIQEPILLKYRSFKKSISDFGELQYKLYTNKPIQKADIFSYVYKVGNQLFIKFYSIPWSVPILLGEVVDGYFSIRYYDNIPIAVERGQTFVVGFTTITTDINYANAAETYYSNNPDYSSFRLVTASEMDTGWPKSIYLESAVVEESHTFIPNVIPSVPSGIYDHSLSITLRASFPDCEIYYSVEDK